MIGYFARATTLQHKAVATQTHVVLQGKCLCGYKPHKTLRFQWNSMQDMTPIVYIECKKCRDRVWARFDKYKKINVEMRTDNYRRYK
jgi:hypothetical protein